LSDHRSSEPTLKKSLKLAKYTSLKMQAFTSLILTNIANMPQVQAHLANPSPGTILIDTREPNELQETGTIPGSINIPITSKPDSFFISAEEFEDRMGFERPGKEKEVVFYCRAGVRSRAAAELARQAGWEKVGEYSGSWLDWEKRGGEKEGVR
jgi:rhodanese-related sulfurtransferase